MIAIFLLHHQQSGLGASLLPSTHAAELVAPRCWPIKTWSSSPVPHNAWRRARGHQPASILAHHKQHLLTAYRSEICVYASNTWRPYVPSYRGCCGTRLMALICGLICIVRHSVRSQATAPSERRRRMPLRLTVEPVSRPARGTRASGSAIVAGRAANTASVTCIRA